MSGKLNTEAFLKRYDAMDERLVQKGFHRTSIWWRRELERFLCGGRRRWVLRVGRRGGKSSFLCRLAVAWALWGPWSVPGGDVAVIAFISVDRDEASSRIRTVRDILQALDITADVRTDEIELTLAPATETAPKRVCIFQVRTCSIKGTVGFTAVLCIADEMARWESREDHSNPAPDIMGSLRPTMATQKLAFEICSSSPWGLDDYHAQLFDVGDNKHQTVSFAETWIANPTVSEELSHELEPDHRVWSREYAAIPGASSSAFDIEDIDRALMQPPTGALLDYRAGSPVAIIDASEGRGDSWTIGLLRWFAPNVRQVLTPAQKAGWDLDKIDPESFVPLNPAAKPYLLLDHVTEFAGKWAQRGVTSDHIAAECVRIAKAGGARVIIGDQKGNQFCQSYFPKAGLSYRCVKWTAGETDNDPGGGASATGSKVNAVMTVRRWLRDNTLRVVSDEKRNMRRQLLAFQEKPAPSGFMTFGARSREHDDLVALLLTAAMADSLKWLPSSPIRQSADFSSLARDTEALSSLMRRNDRQSFRVGT